MPYGFDHEKFKEENTKIKFTQEEKDLGHKQMRFANLYQNMHLHDDDDKEEA